MKRRAIAAAALAVALCGVLTACDPIPLPSGPESSSLDVTLDSHGGARAEIDLASRFRTDGELSQLGQQIGALLFPQATRRTVAVDNESDGLAYVTIYADGAYEPSDHPTFSLDTKSAVAALFDAGPTTVDVTVSAPDVRSAGTWSPFASSTDGYWNWVEVRDPAAAPVGVVQLEPRPWLATLVLLAIVASWVLAIVAIVAAARRRRTAAVVVGVLLTTLAVASLAWSEFNAGDNLGVAGWLSGPLLALAHVAPETVPMTGLIGLIVVIVALVLGKAPAPRRFNPPPGWPTPPEGWLPPPGWRSDPSWPPAPEGWPFLVPVSESAGALDDDIAQ